MPFHRCGPHDRVRREPVISRKRNELCTQKDLPTFGSQSLSGVSIPQPLNSRSQSECFNANKLSFLRPPVQTIGNRSRVLHLREMLDSDVNDGRPFVSGLCVGTMGSEAIAACASDSTRLRFIGSSFDFSKQLPQCLLR